MVELFGLDRFVGLFVWAIMVCHHGRLAVIHGPCVFLAKRELNVTSTVLGSGTFIFRSLSLSWRLNVLLL